MTGVAMGISAVDGLPGVGALVRGMLIGAGIANTGGSGAAVKFRVEPRTMH